MYIECLHNIVIDMRVDKRYIIDFIIEKLT